MSDIHDAYDNLLELVESREVGDEEFNDRLEAWTKNNSSGGTTALKEMVKLLRWRVNNLIALGRVIVEAQNHANPTPKGL